MNYSLKTNTGFWTFDLVGPSMKNKMIFSYLTWPESQCFTELFSSTEALLYGQRKQHDSDKTIVDVDATFLCPLEYSPEGFIIDQLLSRAVGQFRFYWSFLGKRDIVLIAKDVG